MNLMKVRLLSILIKFLIVFELLIKFLIVFEEFVTALIQSFF